MLSDTEHPLIGYLDFETQQIPYMLYRSFKRKRTLEMQVIHPQGLRVVAPKRWGIAAVKKILEEKKTWIFKEWILQAENTVPYPIDWVSGEKIPFLGEIYSLDISPTTKRSACTLGQSTLHVLLSSKSDSAKKIVEQWIKQQAKTILQERCHFFAKQMNLTYQKLSVANQKERWGSCNQHGEIRFNWRLALLPLSIVNYVVVHELAHLVHLHHQPSFWNLVEQYAPDYQKQRKLLKQIAIGRFS